MLDDTGDYVGVPLEVLPDDSPANTAPFWFKPEQVGARQPLLESSGSGAISKELAESSSLMYSVQTEGTSLPKASNTQPDPGPKRQDPRRSGDLGDLSNLTSG